MKEINAYRIAWIVVGCILAEAAFMITQIILTVVSNLSQYSLHDLLQPQNPLYAVPPHFMVVGVVFLITILYGEFRRIRTPFYYITCGLIAALAFHASFWITSTSTNLSRFIIDLVAAIMSGYIYWAVAPRRSY